MSNPLEDVMNGIVEAFDRDTENEITYKDFMKADKDSSLYDIFNTYEMKAHEPLFIVVKIIKQKYGIKKMDDELYRYIRDFPSHITDMADRIEREEGMVCCVDKAWSRSMKHLNDLIQSNVRKETV